MSLNLVRDDFWLPVERQSGSTRIAPWQITDPNDPVLRLASPRADFNGALLQFLIGLLQTACPPADDAQWAEWLEQPPSPERLEVAFEPHAHAFELQGPPPTFMQAYEPLEGESKPISGLLIDAPGAQTLKQNADHFVKRGRVEAICPACAATALLTLQTNAPSGGVGHRTSLRGGGPLTTLVALDPKGRSRLPDDLWRAVWLNVLDKPRMDSLPGAAETKDESAIFPWLAPTRSSEKKTGCDTTPLDAHPLQMYWGMPRRIRIDWGHVAQGTCDLCGDASDTLLSRYVTQNYGVNYTGAWEHPLSPHQSNKTDELLPQHAQPGGISYRHWLGFTGGAGDTRPARVVDAFMHRKKLFERLRLHAFGYDMDNMKARCWYEATFPLYHIDDMIRADFTVIVQQLVEATINTANFTRNCIKDTWFKRPGDAKGDTAFLVEIFIDRTQEAFFTQLSVLSERLRMGDDDSEIRRAWHKVLSNVAQRLFDYWTDRGDFETVDPRRVAEARLKLTGWLFSSKNKGLPKLLEITLKKEKAA